MRKAEEQQPRAQTWSLRDALEKMVKWDRDMKDRLYKYSIDNDKERMQ